jgi:hypothetical protein
MLAEAWATLWVADLTLRLLPVGRLQTGITSTGQPEVKQGDGEDLAVIALTSRLVEIASRHHLYPMRCLRQAVALQWMLKLRHIPTALRIGVQRAGKDLQAHAWLEYRGKPIGQPEGVCQAYPPLLPFEGSQRGGAPNDGPR